MAENKKSFLLYCDLIHTINKLPNEKAGELFKHILSYVNDEHPKTDDLIIEISFEPIRQQLKRDLDKWSKGSKGRTDKARLAGLASAKSRELKATQSNSLVESSTQSTASVNVSVSDNVKGSVINNINSREAEFKNSLQPFLEEFGKEMLNNFYLYWTEKKPKGKKMLFEMQKTFDISRRLKRWDKNNFNKEKSFAQKEKPIMLTEALEKRYGIK